MFEADGDEHGRNHNGNQYRFTGIKGADRGSVCFLSENGINEQNYTALKKKTENESDLRHGSMIEFMLHVGMHARKNVGDR